MSDIEIVELIEAKRLAVDAKHGLVYATKSNNPKKPAGAKTKKGYLRLCVNVGGKQRHFMVHRVVWVSVHGPLKKGHQIDHLNGDKADNRISNLESVTGSENMSRAADAGAFKGVGRKDGIRDSKGRFGKRAAGRLLDGRTHDEFPEVD